MARDHDFREKLVSPIILILQKVLEIRPFLLGWALPLHNMTFGIRPCTWYWA